MSAVYRLAESDRFVQVPFALLLADNPLIGATTVSVYCALRSFATFGRDTGAAVADTRIAARARCSTRQVREERKLLRELGYLSWDVVAGPKGRHNEYVVRLSPEGGAAPHAGPLGGGAAPHAGPMRHHMPHPPAEVVAASDVPAPLESCIRVNTTKPSRVTWITPYVVWWETHLKGQPPVGQIAKLLRPLHETLGAEEVVQRLTHYLADATPRFFSLARFASMSGSYTDPPAGERSKLDPLPGESVDAYLARMTHT